MARTAAVAQLDRRSWSLSFENRSASRQLREEGFFAGHDTKEDLKQELRRLFWTQEQSEPGETLGHYLEPRPSANSKCSTSPSLLQSARIRKAFRSIRTAGPLDNGGAYSTRSAERKAKLAADKKRKSAATEKRRSNAAEKKRKLAADHKLYASGTRRAVTRSSSTSVTHCHTESQRMAPEATDGKAKLQKLDDETAELQV